MGPVSEDVVSVAEAARLLGMTVDEVYELVFTRRLKSVEAPSGRRLVPRAAIDAWKAASSSAST
jgi:excisionase family DNA binding protein